MHNNAMKFARRSSFNSVDYGRHYNFSEGNHEIYAIYDCSGSFVIYLC